MIKAPALIISVLFLLSLFLLSGCTSDVPGIPYSTSQLIVRSTDLNYTLFQQGYYDLNCLIIDGNKISVTDCNSGGGIPVTDYLRYLGGSIFDVNTSDFSGKFLRDDGNWTTITSGSGTDTNVFTAGIMASDNNRFLIDLNVSGKNVYISNGKLKTTNSTLQSPALTYNRAEYLEFANSGVSLVGGADGTSPYGFFLQSRQNVTSDLAYPLLLNPMGGPVGVGTRTFFTANTLFQIKLTTAGSINPANAYLVLDGGGADKAFDIGGGHDKHAIRLFGGDSYSDGPAYQIWSTGSAYAGMYFDAGKAGSNAHIYFRDATSGNTAFKITQAGSASVPSDTKSLFFGAADDASIRYDGTNFLLNPRVVGTGYFGIYSPNNTQTFRFIDRVNSGTPYQHSILTHYSSSVLANNYLAFYISGTSVASQTEKMRIDGAGNVGIGTTTPAQKLDVNGNVQLQGDLNVTGNYYSNGFVGLTRNNRIVKDVNGDGTFYCDMNYVSGLLIGSNC